MPLIEGRVSPLKILTLLSMQCLTTWALSPRLPSMHCGSINCPAWCSKVTIPLGDPPPPTPSARGSSGGFNSYELKDHKLIKVIEEFSPFKIVYKPLGGKRAFPGVPHIIRAKVRETAAHISCSRAGMPRSAAVDRTLWHLH